MSEYRKERYPNPFRRSPSPQERSRSAIGDRRKRSPSPLENRSRSRQDRSYPSSPARQSYPDRRSYDTSRTNYSDVRTTESRIGQQSLPSTPNGFPRKNSHSNFADRNPRNSSWISPQRHLARAGERKSPTSSDSPGCSRNFPNDKLLSSGDRASRVHSRQPNMVNKGSLSAAVGGLLDSVSPAEGMSLPSVDWHQYMIHSHDNMAYLYEEKSHPNSDTKKENEKQERPEDEIDQQGNSQPKDINENVNKSDIVSSDESEVIATEGMVTQETRIPSITEAKFTSAVKNSTSGQAVSSVRVMAFNHNNPVRQLPVRENTAVNPEHPTSVINTNPTTLVESELQKKPSDNYSDLSTTSANSLALVEPPAQPLKNQISRLPQERLLLNRETIRRVPSQSRLLAVSDTDSSDEVLDMEILLLRIEKESLKFKSYSKMAQRSSAKLAKMVSYLGEYQSSSLSQPIIASSSIKVSVRKQSETVVAAPLQDAPISSASSSGSVVRQTPVLTLPPIQRDNSGQESQRPFVPLEESLVLRLKYAEKPTLFHSLKSQKIGSLPRRTRSLVVPFEDRSPLSSIAVTSSLDGQIQFWDVDARCCAYSVSSSTLKHPFAEDMTWISSNILALASDERSKSRDVPLSSHQVSLLYDIRYSRSSTRSPTIHYRLYQPPVKPHRKGISRISPVSQFGSNIRYATGGVDKEVLLWTISDLSGDKVGGVTYKEVHTLHTAEIGSLCYLEHSQVLFTGGLDARFIGWSLEHQKCVTSIDRAAAPIRDVIPIPENPHLMLIGFNDKDSTMKIKDLRSFRDVLELKAGRSSDDEKSATSKYNRASIHPNGHHVALGQAKNGNVQVWDIRYHNVESGPSQTLRIHDGRVLQTKFMQRGDRSWLFSTGADNCLIGTEFSMSS